MYNQKSDLLRVDTIIESSQDKGTQILLTDVNKDYFSFFKTKQDGSINKAAQTFPQFPAGTPVTIVYKNKPYQGKTLRSVVWFEAQNPSKPNPTKAPKASAPAAPTEAMSQYELIARWGQVNHPTYWAFLVAKYKEAHQTAIAAPAIPTSGDEINVEDIPF